MTRWFIRRGKRVGLAPGTFLPVEAGAEVKPDITIFEYSPDQVREQHDAPPDSCQPPPEGFQGVRWINIDRFQDPSLLQTIGDRFKLHPLLLEDVMHTDQRAKVEEYTDCLFIVTRMITYNTSDKLIESEQISFVLGPGYVLTFQEKKGDMFDPVRERIRGAKGRIRTRGADYLAYALMDAIVDHYFVVLEKISEELEDLEDEILEEPTQDTLNSVYRIRREVIYIRKVLWPLREMLGTLGKGQYGLFLEETLLFLRDLQDHAIRVMETLETFREMLGGMVELYLSTNSNRMNEVMKVLTIIATIFIPLTFIAGIYGMNFSYMPELGWEWSYPVVWLVMIVVGIGMVFYFRKRKWL